MTRPTRRRGGSARRSRPGCPISACGSGGECAIPRRHGSALHPRAWPRPPRSRCRSPGASPGTFAPTNAGSRNGDRRPGIRAAIALPGTAIATRLPRRTAGSRGRTRVTADHLPGLLSRGRSEAPALPARRGDLPIRHVMSIISKYVSCHRSHMRFGRPAVFLSAAAQR